MDFPIEFVNAGCEKYGIALHSDAPVRLAEYAEFLVEYNEKVNLTAITQPRDIAIKHFLDCLLLFTQVDLPENAKVIDVGTGAGFPGMVLKIARPDLQVTLLDSLQKRLVFLGELADRLGLQVERVHARAEQAAVLPTHREQYHLATARAVAALPVLTEYCLPFVKKGGLFVAMKGPAAEEEVRSGTKAAELLGGGKFTLNTLQLEDTTRVFALCPKVAPTPAKYPRNSGKIAKQPLG